MVLQHPVWKLRRWNQQSAQLALTYCTSTALRRCTALSKQRGSAALHIVRTFGHLRSDAFALTHPKVASDGPLSKTGRYALLLLLRIWAAGVLGFY